MAAVWSIGGALHEAETLAGCYNSSGRDDDNMDWGGDERWREADKLTMYLKIDLVIGS